MTPQEELAALRRMAELEAKASACEQHVHRRTPVAVGGAAGGPLGLEAVRGAGGG